MRSITDLPEKSDLFIQTDGSGQHIPRRTGGYAYRFIYLDQNGVQVIEDWTPAGFTGAAIGEMELYAVIDSLEKAWRHPLRDRWKQIRIFTDAQYVSKFIYYAINIWPKTKWLKRDGAPVDNVPLWKKLVTLIGRFFTNRIYITIQHEPGKTNEHNKRVDKMAKRSAKTPQKKVLSVSKVRRKRFKNCGTFHFGQIIGQTLSLYVVVDNFHVKQKIYAYKCQIVTKKHPQYKCLGMVYSVAPVVLNAGHCYLVEMSAARPGYVEINVREHKKRKA